MDSQSLLPLQRFQQLKTARVKGQRVPHKPLLILVALAQWQQGTRQVAYANIEPLMVRLLKLWAPPTRSKPEPKLPYWYLQSDGVWQIIASDQLPRGANGLPTAAGLRQSHAAFTDDVQQWLQQDDTALLSVAHLLLETYFLPSTHELILDQCGLDIPLPFQLGSLDVDSPDSHRSVRYSDTRQPRQRSAMFRKDVLKAYDYRCVVSGFQINLGGSYLGCEAAHVQAHAFDGPDTVDNGIVLEPTLHRLFDCGVWSLTDDRRILVSQEFTGSDPALERIRSLSGQPIRAPLPGQPELKPEYIRWHREANLGGVFRGPALKL